MAPPEENYRRALYSALTNFRPGSFCLGLQPPDNAKAVDQIRKAIHSWSQDPSGPQKMLVPLEDVHFDFSKFSLETLRGPDRAKVEALMQSAQAGPSIHWYLGTLLRQQFVHKFDANDDEIVYKRYAALHNLRSPREKTRSWWHMSFKKEEVILDELDKEEFTTEVPLSRGNFFGGKQWERFCSQGVIVLWPHTKQWDIAFTENVDKALEEGLTLVRTVSCVRGALEDACKTGGHLSAGKAATIANAVMEHGSLEVVEELRYAMAAARSLRTGELSPMQRAKLCQLVEGYASSPEIMEKELATERTIECAVPGNRPVQTRDKWQSRRTLWALVKSVLLWGRQAHFKQHNCAIKE